VRKGLDTLAPYQRYERRGCDTMKRTLPVPMAEPSWFRCFDFSFGCAGGAIVRVMVVKRALIHLMRGFDAGIVVVNVGVVAVEMNVVEDAGARYQD
jgi:hypothetical protein